ncbi:hypothetical protein LG200_01280 [Methylobacillus caricis]|uniref:hypothetical protein n=1 Tax=Methylobacillus caricis TaxID=1971611 RepID=UPI001CFFFEDB|nr:hypothetical protein [Methylobacillus caricis]MCB5186632.1 hypothetical protein [Methylobacillus caricis]
MSWLHISETLTIVNSEKHIHYISDLLFNANTMRTIGEIRRIRLEELVQQTKSKTLEEVAEIAGLSAAYLSQVRNRLPDSKSGTPKELGKIAAGKLCAGFKKPSGWMDNLDPDHGFSNEQRFSVQEAAQQYAANAWPFRRVSRNQYHSLSREQQDLVEIKILNYVDDNNYLKNHKKSKKVKN